MRTLEQKLSRRGWLAGSLAAVLSPTSAAAQPQPIRLPRKVRLGLIGLDGHTGELIQPLPQLPDVELVAVADPKPDALAAFARRRGMEKVRRYADYREMLAKEELDLAGICNPNNERAQAVLDAIERGLHVVAEKPLALTLEDLDRIRKALQAKRVRLTILLPMRFDSPYLAMKAVVESGEVGEILQIAAQKSYKAGERPEWMKRQESFGGTIPWIGIHMIDLMRWTSGREFKEVYSIAAHIDFPEIGEMENVTASLFRLDNGGAAVLRMDYLRPETAPTHGDDRLRLAGTRGIVEYQAATGVTVMTRTQAPRRIEPLPPKQWLFVDFLESVYLGKPHSLSLEDIWRVNEITLLAHQSAVERRVIQL